MKKINKIKNGSIVYFGAQSQGSLSNLKYVLNALKSLGHREYFKFSHVSTSVDFVKNLSVIENMSIESDTNIVVENSRERVEQKVKGNPDLKALLFQIENLNANISETNKKDSILASFIKGMIKDTQLIIIDNIDQELGHFQTKLVQRAIKNKSEKDNSIFIIVSNDPKLWGDIITAGLIRKKSGAYELTKLNQKNDKNKVSDTEAAGYLSFSSNTVVFENKKIS